MQYFFSFQTYLEINSCQRFLLIIRSRDQPFNTRGGGWFLCKKNELFTKFERKNSLLYKVWEFFFSFMCQKKKNCGQPADRSKSAGNCQRRRKKSSLISVKCFQAQLKKNELFSKENPPPPWSAPYAVTIDLLNNNPFSGGDRLYTSESDVCSHILLCIQMKRNELHVTKTFMMISY